MWMDNRRIRPGTRLDCAIELLGSARVVADVGCDHGRLGCALMQRGSAQKCIAIDISSPSLEKTTRLTRKIGVQDRVETRLGDGLTPLAPGEADAIAILGMGGTQMTRILDGMPPLNGARVCVFQPMRAAEDIRRWLYERSYPILEDRVVFEAGRYYQVFSAGQPQKRKQPLPDGWPEDLFFLGYTAFERREPQMKPLVERMIETARRKQKTQRAEALDHQLAQLLQIRECWEDKP